MLATLIIACFFTGVAVLSLWLYKFVNFIFKLFSKPQEWQKGHIKDVKREDENKFMQYTFILDEPVAIVIHVLKDDVEHRQFTSGSDIEFKELDNCVLLRHEGSSDYYTAEGVVYYGQKVKSKVIS